MDPAHSLSDSFAETIGTHRRPLGGRSNLDGIEVNAVAKFEELKERYRKWIDEIFTSLAGGSNWSVQFDREAMLELISLAPPGIDEISALSSVSDFLADGAYTCVILDTAPTGHLLRFLELPEVALDWVRTFIRLLLKYREFVTSSEVAEELIALSKSIKRVMTTLKDPASCEFLAVSIAERMSLEETSRLRNAILHHGLRLGSIIVNNVVPETAAGTCPFCRGRRASQLAHLEAFRRLPGPATTIVVSPQHPAEVRGPSALAGFIRAWQSVPARGKAAKSES
jgi:arsenite-transporting ATPase